MPRRILPPHLQTALPSRIREQRPGAMGGSLALKPGPAAQLVPVDPWLVGGAFRPARGRPAARGVAREWTNPYRGTIIPFSVDLVSEQIIPANRHRCYVLIQNLNAANDMWVNFGVEAAVNASILIIPRGNYELIGGAQRGAPFSPADSIHVLGTVAAQFGIVSEGVYWGPAA